MSENFIDYAFGLFMGSVALAILSIVFGVGVTSINTWDLPEKSTVAPIIDRSWTSRAERGTACFVLDGDTVCADFLRRAFFDRTREGKHMRVQYVTHRITGTRHINSIAETTQP